jgi:hypothetical protein
VVSLLTVPQQKPGGAVTVPLTPAKTREWLDQLSLDETEDSLTKIYHEIHDLNRIPLKPGARLQLLEHYGAPLASIGERIESDLSGRDIPLPKPLALVAEINKQAAIEMAYGYKCAVLDLAKTFRTSRANRDLGTAIHRSISYLLQTVFRSTMFYNSPPPGTWIEVHSLFSYARKLGLQDVLVKDTLNSSKPKTTITHVYQQAILFGVSDAYRLSGPVKGKLYRYLDRWASHARTTDFESVPNTRCQFIVDPEQDRPARALDPSAAPKINRSMLLMDARAITNIAHNHWNEIRAGTQPKSHGLPEGFFDGSSFGMLEQVIRAWGVAPQRKHPRNPITGPYLLVSGIDACAYCVNGERKISVAASAKTCSGPRTPAPSAKSAGAPTGEGLVWQNWAGVNESFHGICLTVDLSRPSSVLVRIGDIVAYRVDRQNARWSPGVVRWSRITDAVLQIGIQRIGVDCRPASVQPATTGSEQTPGGFSSALFVPADSDSKRLPSLLAPAGTFRVNRRLVVDDGTITRVAVAGKLLERSAYFDWFEFTLSNH